ncbi:hypothetical protein LMG667_03375 [Xanthomonas euvesicatoria]|uniref:hypothetical protein n=1 Tax=Xanthomonas euvesicatoria TaxID=456327 RepID=UPI00080DD5C8|nr:hypothetical protein [Xanthomonas euvesicatoria]OCG90026.1 hypothetical protein LMG667_03375 [Xanthomonas euvesicatoria]
MRWLDLNDHGLAVYCKGAESQRYLVLQALDGQPQPRREQAEALGFALRDGSFVLDGTQISLNKVKSVYPKAAVREMTEHEVRGPEPMPMATQLELPQAEQVAYRPVLDVEPHQMTRAQFIERAHVYQGQGGWHVDLQNVAVDVPDEVRVLSPRTQVKTVAGHVHEALVLAADQANPRAMRLDVLADYPDVAWRGSSVRGRQHSINATKLLGRLGIAGKLLAEFDGPHECGACKIYNPPYQRLSVELLPYEHPKFEGKALYMTHYRDDGLADGEVVFGIAMGRLWLTETAVNIGREIRGCDAQFANVFTRNLLSYGFDKPDKVTVDFPRASRENAVQAYEEHPEMFVGRSRAEEEEPEPQLKPGL